jgi:hypothetical protein
VTVQLDFLHSQAVVAVALLLKAVTAIVAVLALAV